MFLIVFLVLIAALAIWTLSIQPGKDYPPGPFRFPIIGTFWAMVRKPKNRHITVDLLQKYGQGEIISIKLGTRDMVVLGTPDLMHEAFLTQSAITSGRPKTFISAAFDGVDRSVVEDPVQFEKWQRGGVIGSVGELWRQNRKLAFTKLFSKHRIHLMEDRIMEEIQLFLQYAEKKSHEGTPLEPVIDLASLAMNIITRIAFSERFNHWDQATTNKSDQSAQIGDAVRKIFHFFRPSNPEVTIKFLGQFPWSESRQYEKNSATVRRFLEGILRQREAEANSGSMDDSELNFLDIMIRAKREDSEYSDVDNRSMVTSMLDFLLAGTDTTSMSVASLLRHLANDQALQKRLQDELDAVVGNDRSVRVSDLEKLPLLDACVLEQMRLWSVAPLTLIHVTTEDLQLRHYKIPKGTFMVGALNNFLMDKTEFPEPEKFIPERWLNNLDLEKSKFFTPFGVGPRICVGRYLAESESRLIVANFLQRFSIAPFEAQSIPYTDVNYLTTAPAPYKISVKLRV